MSETRPYKHLLIAYDDDTQKAEVLITRDDGTTVSIEVPTVRDSLLKMTREHVCPNEPFGGCYCDMWEFGYWQQVLTLRLVAG